MKERLTGAVILVALIVLLVPELLSGPLRSASHRSAATAAASEGAPPRTVIISLADDGRARTAPSATVEAAPAPAPAAAAPATPAAPAASAVDGSPGAASDERSNTPTASAAPATAAPAAHSTGGTAAPAVHPAASPATANAAGTSGGWMVQLGSFASRDNAERLAKQLHGSGFQVSVSQGTSGRRLYRVRAGPVQDHAAAEQLAGKLRAAGHTGAIVPK